MALKHKTIRLKRSTRLAREGSFLAGAGKDERLPIGILSSDSRRHRAYARLADNRFPSGWFDPMYAIERVELWGYKVGYFRVSEGGPGRVRVRRATAGENEGTSDTLSSTNGGGAVWPGPSTHAGSEVRGPVLPSGTGKWVKIAVITDLSTPWWPGRLGGSNDAMLGLVLAQDSDDWTANPGYTGTTDNVEFASDDWGDGGRALELRFFYDDNVPPDLPEVLSPEPNGSRSEAAVQVASANGRDLVVEFNFNDPDDTVPDQAQLRVFADAITDATKESTTPRVTTGVVDRTTTGAFRPVGPARRYSIRTTVPLADARTDLRYDVSVRDDSGAWSRDPDGNRWTSVDNGRIRTAYLPGVPLQPSMTTNPEGAVISGTINSADTGDYVRRWAGEFFRDNPDGSQTPLWSTEIDLGDSPSLRRPAIPYAGVQLNDGDKVRWRQRHWNRDLVEGPWSAYAVTTMKAQVGPTITPADTTTKLTSRAGPVTIASTSFDAYQFRLYRGTTQIHDSGLVGMTADTSVAVSLPAGVVQWGDTLEIEAAVRPAGTTTLGPFSPRSQLYIDTLPTTTITASDGEGATGAVIPTTDIEWALPYLDPDRGNFGEQPEAQELELRVAASPAGSGTLIEKRTSVAGIVEDVRTGIRLDEAIAATGWVGDTNVTPGTEAQNPTGYSGVSLEFVFGSSSTDRGAWKELAEPLDLSVYGLGALLRVHRRGSSNTNLTTGRLRLGSSGSDYHEYQILAAAFTIDTWAEVTAALGTPTATVGTPDLTAIDRIGVWADVSAAYAASWYLRDLRLGAVQTAKDTPDGHIAPEASVDARARYRDDADPKASTTLAASSVAGATNVKVTAVTDMAAGDWLTAETDGLVESRQIVTVGTAGAGGTGITVSEAFTHAHGSGEPAVVHHWGPWTTWTTVKASLPPVVAADTPADEATVTDPTPALTHTYSSPGSKDQASHTVRVFLRVDDVDELLYERTTDDDALTDTLPSLLLADATEYAWEVEASDTDGLSDTTARRTFTTDLTTPTAVADLVATADPVAQSITLAWTASADTHFDHYRVHWRDDLTGQDIRIDLGPREVDDGRTKLTDPTFTYYGGRLGANGFAVTVHNGSQESEQTVVETTLAAARGGSWQLAADGEERYTFPFDADDVTRPHTGTVERFTPPGRPYPVHLHWGTNGRRVSLRLAYLPAEDGDLVTPFAELFGSGVPVWCKAPEGYRWDVMRVVVVGVTDSPDRDGFMRTTVDLDEVARVD